MSKIKSGLAGICVLALAACGGMSPGARTAAGAAGGAAAGYAAADLLGADSDWKIISALAGAAGGTLVARNPRNNRCAYSDGKGGYVKRRCN
ncbi:MAG: glucose-6-phosphate isomerase [Roseovarius sp.]|nr:glucose-6-phosphate isomerase [Roseovarius sp.]